MEVAKEHGNQVLQMAFLHHHSQGRLGNKGYDRFLQSGKLPRKKTILGAEGGMAKEEAKEPIEAT